MFENLLLKRGQENLRTELGGGAERLLTAESVVLLGQGGCWQQDKQCWSGQGGC